jgi:hypothetical protein
MFEVLTEKLGYEVDGEFSEDYDGIVDFTKKVAEKMLEEEFQNLYGALPDVFEYMQYRQNGGDPKTFFETAFKEVDYTKVQLNEGDERGLISVISDLMRRQGDTPEEIQEAIEDYKDNMLLYKQATNSLPKLIKMQEEESKKIFEEQKLRAEEFRKEQEIQWRTIGETIKSGKLDNFSIPEADKRAFFEWLSTPVTKDGKTKMQLTREQMKLDQALAIDYFLFKGLDLNKLVQNTKQTQQANNLRAKLQQSKPGASVRMKTGAQTSARGVSLPGLNDLF